MVGLSQIISIFVLYVQLTAQLSPFGVQVMYLNIFFLEN